MSKVYINQIYTAQHRPKMNSQDFWLKDPTVLLNKDYINQVWPKRGMSSEEKLNAASRLVVFLTILGYLITMSTNVFMIGAVTLGVIVLIHQIQANPKASATAAVKTTEGFSNNINKPEFYNALKGEFTAPTVDNPLMNPLLTEITGNPKRRNAAPAFNPAVEAEINESTKQFVSRNFDKNASNLVKDGAMAIDGPPNHSSKETYDQLFGTLGDNSVFETSMRNFYATPNSRIPNDQTAFAKYCYGDMTSCKEGDEFACGRINSRIGAITGQ